MLNNPWDYSLAIYGQDWTPLARMRVDPDWEPAREWTRLCALNAGVPLGARNIAEVRPIWNGSGPALSGFRMAIETEGEPREVSCDFTLQYFHEVAQQAAASLMEAGCLTADPVFRYVISATPSERSDDVAAASAFTVRDVTPMPALVSAPLLDCAVAIGEPAPQQAPAFVPSQVLDEISALTRHAAPFETGGALVGRLQRDDRAQRAFMRVTDQIPARYTEASAVRLLFTADTWSSLRREIAARGCGEIIVGWWHSHPVQEWCRLNGCPEWDHDTCAPARDTFSKLDRALHRTVFVGAHTVALVASDVSPATLSFSAYGWSLGALRARSVCVI